MSANKLEDEIRKALEENPALEAEKKEEPIQDNYLELLNEREYEDSYAEEKRLDYKYENFNKSKDEKEKDQFIVQDSSIQESLLLQLRMQKLTERENFIAEYLIGNLDDSGFLATDSKTCMNELLLAYNMIVTPQEIEKIVENVIQEIDPPGVGARNLQECFLIQLRRKEKTPSIRLAENIVKNYFKELLKKHYSKIISHFGINEKLLKEALHEIQKLDPSPGFSLPTMQSASTWINPDFIVEIENEKIILSINNQYIPKIKINKDFTLQYHFLNSERNQKTRDEAERFLKENIDNAQILIDSLSQREAIMYNIMYAIIQRQKEYFLSGSDIDIKPMVLKDLAQELGVDVSTVSRASSNKYVQIPHGTIPVKHLFSESIGDENVSSKKMKKLISQFIAQESNTHPYTDEQICQYLIKQGYNIARRTIAKYREQLHIPVARLRKKI